MSDFEDVERLIRLKRHEQPPEDFVEDFMIAFHQRQRVELMNQSARGLVMERLRGVVESLFTPKYAFATLAACAVVGAGVFQLVPSSADSEAHQVVKLKNPAAVSYDEFQMARAEMRQNPQYLGSHYKGGFGDAQEVHAVQRDAAQPKVGPNGQQVQGTALPASYSPSGSNYGFKLDLD